MFLQTDDDVLCSFRTLQYLYQNVWSLKDHEDARAAIAPTGPIMKQNLHECSRSVQANAAGTSTGKNALLQACRHGAGLDRLKLKKRTVTSLPVSTLCASLLALRVAPRRILEGAVRLCSAEKAI